jgi:uncharacterized secreted protein with C-terminal beta-propeller domain
MDLLMRFVIHFMDVIKIFGIGIFVLLIAFTFGCVEPPDPEANNTEADLKKFESIGELKTYLATHTMSRGYDYGMMEVTMSAPTSGMQNADSAKASDYSQTNIQVQGVDEADIVKSDGKYLYILSGSKLVIVDAYPAENAKILSEIDVESPQEIFINQDKLVIFARDSWYNTTILQYDVTDRTNPILDKNISVEGNYFDSRMIGDHVYALINKPVYYYWGQENDIAPPVIRIGDSMDSSFPDVYHFDEPAYDYRFTTAISIDLSDDSEAPKSKIFLMGSSQEMFVSQNNIYVTFQKVSNFTPIDPFLEPVKMIMPIPYPEYKDETAIHRIAIKDGEVKYAATGSVPGHVLNQFSMDEYNGYFRIATTSGHVSRTAEGATSKNNIYVLDSSMNITGSLEDLAPGERIYSARFMGDRSYLVTFKKVDPLFVIDMKDPTNPYVLGKLKIPGYSDYLHPYDENHLIGLGKETVESETGDFAWYQGVKLSLFDVTDVTKPIEKAKYEIGDRGTSSNALYDHKAFLFSKSKNLLVIPITLAEIDPEQYPQGVPDWHHGSYTFQGAYVFNISAESGINLKGRISHVRDESSYLKSGYYYESEYAVKRSLYMDNTLYTISNGLVKMNDLTDLSDINEVTLPYTQEYPYWYYYE